MFALPAIDAGKRVYLDFDGVMAMPTVYINGQKAGGWDIDRTTTTELSNIGSTKVEAAEEAKKKL